MPKHLTNVRVKKDNGTIYIDQATGSLYEDEKNDNNVYVIITGGIRHPTHPALVKKEIYSISCDQEEFQNLYAYLNFICFDPDTLAEFRLQMTNT